VAPTIVDEMLKEPDKLKVGGQKMDITCLFSDVRDFTSISEKLSATELAQSLNRYMGAMTDIVFDTQGTLDKYIGDAIVAFWGAPVPIENHPYEAIKAAIKMIEVLPSINEKFKTEGEESLRNDERGKGATGRPKGESLEDLTYDELLALVEIQQEALNDIRKQNALARKKKK
jgi:class 3 adenylate cyclase